MMLRLLDISIKLYIGDLEWEKKKQQKILVSVEIRVNGRPPDYWKISKALVGRFSKSRYEWVEDLAQAMASYLKKEFAVHGRLTLSKFPPLPKSPKIFQVEKRF